MKIKITTTVDVDPNAWAEEFGLVASAPVVRADVQTYFAGLVHDQLETLGLGFQSADELEARFRRLAAGRSTDELLELRDRIPATDVLRRRAITAVIESRP